MSDIFYRADAKHYQIGDVLTAENMRLLEELGVAPKDVPLEEFLKIGRALGARRDQITVGMGSGAKGPMVFNALSSGIVSAGCNVKNIGIAPSPTLALASKDRSMGMMICSPEYSDEDICMKLWNRDGTMFTDLNAAALRESLSSAELPPCGSVGSITMQSGAIHRHRNAITNILGGTDCPVVLDCASDCASLIAPALLTDMGCDLIAINSQLDLRHRGHGNIGEGSLRDLISVVHRNAGEIGIAINGDGTRAAAVDESGRYLSGETLLAIFAEYLNPKRIVVPISASMMIDDLTECEVIRVPPGDPSLGESVMKHDADFGGSASGSFVFPKLTYCPDGIYSAALLAKIAGESRLNEMVDSLPQYYMDAAAVRFEGKENDVAKKISDRISGMDYQDLIDTDGWRVEMDGGWYLIRFSNNEENVIRITAEARDEVYMISLMDIARDVVSSALK